MTSLGPRVVGAVLVVAGVLLGYVALSELDGAPLTVEGPRFAPLVVTALWTVLAVVLLLRPGRAPVEPVTHRWAPVLLVAALVGYVTVLQLLGFALTSTVFFIAAARILGSRQWLRDTVVAVPLSFGVYLAFTRLLDIRLPEGVLPW